MSIKPRLQDVPQICQSSFFFYFLSLSLSFLFLSVSLFLSFSSCQDKLKRNCCCLYLPLTKVSLDIFSLSCLIFFFLFFYFFHLTSGFLELFFFTKSYFAYKFVTLKQIISLLICWHYNNSSQQVYYLRLFSHLIIWFKAWTAVFAEQNNLDEHNIKRPVGFCSQSINPVVLMKPDENKFCLNLNFSWLFFAITFIFFSSH